MSFPNYLIYCIDKSEDELLASLSHPEFFAEKVVRLKSGSRRRQEVLAVRYALKQLMNGQEKEVIYDQHGAPRLSDGDWQISISHTQEYVAVIVSDKPVGIDIERRGDRVQRVVSHFLQSDERDLLCLCSVDDDTFTLALHLAWSAKEAAFKVLGQNYYDLQHLTTIVHLDWQSKLIKLLAANRQEPLTLHFDYTEQYVLVWVQLD